MNILAFTFGCNFSWASIIITYLHRTDELNPFSYRTSLREDTLVASLYYAGTILGPLFGLVLSAYRRKKVLVASGCLSVAAYVMTAHARTLNVMCSARFLMGVSNGLGFAVLPLYIGEISEKSVRGFLSCISNVMAGMGSLFCFGVAPRISIKLFSYLNVLIMLLYLIALVFFIPESPYLYMTKNLDELAKASLKKFRRGNANIEEELLELKRYIEQSKGHDFWAVYRYKEVYRAFEIVNILLTFQKFTGNIFLMTYMQIILDELNTLCSSQDSLVIIGLIQLTIIVLAMKFTDTWGRKILLLVSASGISLTLFCLGIYCFLLEHQKDVSDFSWFPLAAIILYKMSFVAGYAIVPLIIIGELFPSSVKLVSCLISTSISNTLGFLIILLFPHIQNAVGISYTFWIFAVCTAFSIIYITFWIPETKGKSFYEIQLMLGSRRNTN